MNKVILSLVFFVAAAITFSCCQKEMSFERSVTDSTGNGSGSGSGSGSGNGSGSGTGTNAALVGDWKFVVLNGKEISGGSATFMGHTTKTETSIEYATTDNAGTLKISDTKYDMNNLAYKISTTQKGRIYLDGVVQSAANSDLPFSDELSPTSSSTDYKLIGSDSLNFTGGDFISFSSLFSDAPTGVRYKIDGNKLTVTLKQSTSSTDNSGPYPVVNYESMEMKFTFQKP